MQFDVQSALFIFIADFIFWFLTTIFVRHCNGNLIIIVMIVAGLTNASDFVSKYFAPRYFNNIIVAIIAAAVGAGLAMLIDKHIKKRKQTKTS